MSTKNGFCDRAELTESPVFAIRNINVSYSFHT